MKKGASVIPRRLSHQASNGVAFVLSGDQALWVEEKTTAANGVRKDVEAVLLLQERALIALLMVFVKAGHDISKNGHEHLLSSSVWLVIAIRVKRSVL